MERQNISEELIDAAMTKLREGISHRLAQKGRGSFSSKHEILGIVTEEYHELVEAVHAGAMGDVSAELGDLAVAAVFGFACMHSGNVDW